MSWFLMIPSNPPFNVAWDSKNEWESYHLAMKKIPNTFFARSRAKDKWLSPVAPWFKINWNAIVYKEGQKRGTCIIIKDSIGKVLTCLSSSYTFFPNPLLENVKLCGEHYFFVKNLVLTKLSLKEMLNKSLTQYYK